MTTTTKRGEKEAYIISTIQEVYENPEDHQCGIPPLFRFKYEAFDIDMERVEEIEAVKLTYKVKSPLPQTKPKKGLSGKTKKK